MQFHLIRAVVLAGCLLAGTSLCFGQAAGTPESASPSLQDLIDQLLGGPNRPVPRSGGWGAVRSDQLAAGAPWNQRAEVGTVIEQPYLIERFDSDMWRNRCFSYEGLTHFDGQALNFTYGGPGKTLIYQFDHPAVARGGCVAFDLIYGSSQSLQVGIAHPLRPAFPLPAVQDATRVVAFLPKSDSPIWIVFDASPGKGAVMDSLVISFERTPGPGEPPVIRPQDAGLPPTGRLAYDAEGRPVLYLDKGPDAAPAEAVPE